MDNPRCPLISKFLTLDTSAQSLLPGKATYSQVLGIETGIYGEVEERQYSAYHVYKSEIVKNECIKYSILLVKENFSIDLSNILQL